MSILKLLLNQQIYNIFIPYFHSIITQHNDTAAEISQLSQKTLELDHKLKVLTKIQFMTRHAEGCRLNNDMLAGRPKMTSSDSAANIFMETEYRLGVEVASGRGAFSVAGPRAWNELPADMRHITETSTYRLVRFGIYVDCFLCYVMCCRIFFVGGWGAL